MEVSKSRPVAQGDVVLISHKRIGVVRYVGAIAEYMDEFGDCIWYGIEIRITEGVLGLLDCDGSVRGTSYFECAPNDGLFVRLDQILRRIEPEELLEKVVKLKKTKNSMHKLLEESHVELTRLKKQSQIKAVMRPRPHSTKRSKDRESRSSATVHSLDSSVSDPAQSGSIELSQSNDSRYSDEDGPDPNERIESESLSPKHIISPKHSKEWVPCLSPMSSNDELEDQVPSLRNSRCSLAQSEAARVSRGNDPERASRRNLVGWSS